MNKKQTCRERQILWQVHHTSVVWNTVGLRVEGTHWETPNPALQVCHTFWGSLHKQLSALRPHLQIDPFSFFAPANLSSVPSRSIADTD